MISFDSLGLSAELLRAVSAQGYLEPTPIQRQAIPIILEGRDVMAGAQTGTGKTAGFTLPMLQRLSDPSGRTARRAIRALVLTPTRELAAQVGASIATYGRHLPLQSTVIFGGVNIKPQIERLRRGVDILVATPGRLLDHAGQKTLDLSRIEILVLDEADRMLDMGFIHDIRRILALLPDNGVRQNLLFSATFPTEIKDLADRMLNRPKLIEAARRRITADGIEQVVHPVDKHRKRELLSQLIGSGDWRQVAGVHTNQTRRQPPGTATGTGWIDGRCDPWKQEPGRSNSCVGRVQERRITSPGRNRSRVAWIGHRSASACRQLRTSPRS